jgi:hypothetical protein
MTKPKNSKILLAFLLVSFLMLLTAGLAKSNPAGITVTSVDSSGHQTEVYNVGDAMCLSGTGFAASTTYNVYVVYHGTLVDGTAFPARVSGSVTTLTTDASGTFTAVPLWPSAQASVTDMVVDVNGDGIYEASIDAVDGNHVTGGFVAPEYPLYALLATTACFAAFATFKIARPFKINLHKP